MHRRSRKIEVPQMSERTIQEKINNDYYKNKKPYETDNEIRRTLEKLADMIITALEKNMSESVITSLMSEVSPRLRALDDVKEHQRKYNEENARLFDLFREDLKMENGTMLNPYESEIFSLSWELGHSSGYGEVASYYADISHRFKYPPKPQ